MPTPSAPWRREIDGDWDLVGLPMPRNPALLDPATPRLRVRTVTDRFPFPIPNGWFVVAMSDDSLAGGSRRSHYFGRDLVLFRTEAGEPRLADAYCAHLGAHLAVGGKVEGDCIRCPFHGWAYDGDVRAVRRHPVRRRRAHPGQGARSGRTRRSSAAARSGPGTT